MAHEFSFAVVVTVVMHAVVGVAVSKIVDAFAVRLVIFPVAFIN
jgi:hypothetical protein